MVVCVGVGLCNECGAEIEPHAGRGRPRKKCRQCAPPWAGKPWAEHAPPSADELASRKQRYAERERVNRARKRAERIAAHPRLCEFCRKPIDFSVGTLRRFCDRTCGKGYLTKPGSLKPIPCPECATVFLPRFGYQKFCTVKCSRRHLDRPRSAARRGRVSDGEKVNPIEVFARDRWRCQLCGTPTPRKLRGTFEPAAPELDHIVPLAAGGAHTYTNTQCACRRCNATKQDRPLGQMRMFG